MRAHHTGAPAHERAANPANPAKEGPNLSVLSTVAGDTPARPLLAVDPGLSGALAFYDPDAPDRVALEDMPVVAGEIDVAQLRERVRAHRPAFAVVERVASRPTDSRPAAFAFGGAYYAARTVLALEHIPTHLVTPQTWKRHHRLIGASDPAEAARGLALRLFPACAASFARKKDHHKADAALLALFAAAAING